MKQISIFEIIPKGQAKKTRQILKPKVCDCYTSCKNFSTTLPDGRTDRYVTGQPRCVNCRFDNKSLIINNTWYLTCQRYEVKDNE